MALREDVSERAHARIGSVLRQKWRLDTVIGIGGMASVYAATHRNGSRVAIKMLHPEVAIDQEVTSRFLREGYVANAVGHPGTVTVLDDDVAEDGAPFLVMELLEGETLDARLVHGGLMALEEAVLAVDRVLDVLAAAHEKDIVHRDIKPENLFVTRTGVIKVLDFGIARLRELSLSSGGGTRAGSVLGTPAYMAPEQALGHWSEVDGRTDIWAVGATVYTLLSGRSVHEGDTVQAQLVLAATKKALPLASVVPGTPPRLAAVIDRALAFERRERWPDARSMQAALRDGGGASLGLGTLASVARPRPPIEQGPTLVAPSGAAQAASAASESFFAAQGMSRSASGSSRRSPLTRWALAAVALTVVALAVVLVRSLDAHPPIGPATDVTQVAASTGAVPPPPPSVVASPEVRPATAVSGAALELPRCDPSQEIPRHLEDLEGDAVETPGQAPARGTLERPRLEPLRQATLSMTRPTLHRVFALASLAFAVALVAPRGAQAQARDSAGAEALFREGRALITSGDVAGACAKFRESNHLDPAIGTVFNIADCEEQLGHLAQAWTLFQEVVQRLPANDDRHGIAEKRAAALEPRLPHLRVRLASNAPAGTRVERDGVELGTASLESSLPVDPGAHRLRVSAPGHEPRDFSISLHEAENKTLDVSPGPASSTPAKTTPHVVDEPNGSGQKTLGYVVGGIGIVGLVTGAVAGVLVLGAKSTVDENCDANKRCNQEGLDAAERGKTLGVVTTVGLVTGAVGLGAGTYLVLSAAPSRNPETRAVQANVVARF